MSPPLPPPVPDEERPPTDGQRRALDLLLYHVLVEVRALCRDGRMEQVRDLAEASHNLPLVMWHPRFSFRRHITFFRGYQERHPGRSLRDYAADLRSIAALPGGVAAP